MKSRIFDRLFLLLVVAGAFLLRSVFCYSLIFHDGRVHLRTDDPYFHVHLERNLIHHFPRPNVFDPALHSWSGQVIVVGPLLDFLVAGTALIFGFGRPDAAPVEAVAAWMPVVLGALTAVPVFLLARRLWGRWAAGPAAVLIAVMPGQFLRRTMLGFADHHALEVFLVAVFLWLAAETVGRPTLSLRTSIPSGIALGAYLAAWSAADVVLAILAVWLIAEFLISLRSSDPEFVPGTFLARALPVAAVVLLPWAAFDSGCRRHAGICLALAAFSMALVAARSGVRRDRPSRRSGATLLVVAAVIGLAALPEVFPGVGTWLVKAFARLGEGGGNSMISEDAPLSATGPGLAPFIREFGFAWIAALAGIAISAIARKRRESSFERLLLLWTGVMLVLTLRQNRFSYYLAIGVALFAGRAIAAAARSELRGARPVAAVAAALLAAVCLRPAVALASRFSGPSADWEETLGFLKIISPPPFSDPKAGERVYPRSFKELPVGLRPQYGVMAWWDYGYWILDLAGRVPDANPSQIGIGVAAEFLLETDPERARAKLNQRRTRYVILDSQLPILPIRGAGSPLAGKFSAIASAGSHPLRRFFEKAGDGRGGGSIFFTADYFRTMLVRLYLFGGRHVDPVPPIRVARFRALAGETEVEDVRDFASYAGAVDFVRGDPRFHLVSVDPTASCVELQESRGFSEIHDSPTRFSAGKESPARVELFEVSAR